MNATELPDSAPYVSAEMRILEWIGKPVIVLLNQIGQPKQPEAEQADVDRWKQAMAAYPIVSSVLSMDAFARCWVQEFALFDAIAKALPEEQHSTLEALREVWSRRVGLLITQVFRPYLIILRNSPTIAKLRKAFGYGSA